jgi:hypothetical protein
LTLKRKSVKEKANSVKSHRYNCFSHWGKNLDFVESVI